jgi:hypothetical protein
MQRRTVMTFRTGFFCFLSKKVSREQARDSGMVIVLICLIIGLTAGNHLFFKIAIGALFIDMIWPKIFLPAAIIWQGFANITGGIMSKIILTLIFFLVVTPIGFLKRCAGSEPLQLKEWKQSKNSVFKIRNRSYSARDFEKPY